jgi:hypothetical protein
MSREFESVYFGVRNQSNLPVDKSPQLSALCAHWNCLRFSIRSHTWKPERNGGSEWMNGGSGGPSSAAVSGRGRDAHHGMNEVPESGGGQGLREYVRNHAFSREVAKLDGLVGYVLTDEVVTNVASYGW